MVDKEDNYFSYPYPEEYFEHEQHSINLYAESKIEEPKNVSTGENHGSNSLKSEKNDNIDNQFINASNKVSLSGILKNLLFICHPRKSLFHCHSRVSLSGIYKNLLFHLKFLYLLKKEKV